MTVKLLASLLIVRNTKPFGIYQGSKDNRDNIENSFASIFSQLNRISKNTFLSLFKFTSDLLATDQQNLEPTETHKENALPKFQLTLNHENKNVKRSASLLPGCDDENNGHFSIQCL